MKWFDKWLLKKAEKIALKRNAEEMVTAGNIAIGKMASPRMDRLESNGIQFKVYKASGGMVIETSTYDRRTDRHNGGLYVVTDEQDLGKEISKIITLEALKN